MQSQFGEPPPQYSPGPPTGAHNFPYQQPTAPPLATYNIYTQPPRYGATSQTTILIQEPEIIVVGACPACRIGILQDNFTCLGLLCAIFFFPLGLLCCLLLREKTCSNCGANFG